MNTHLRVFCIGLMIATVFGCGEQSVTEPVEPRSPQDSHQGDDATLTDIDEGVGLTGDTSETHDSGPESDVLATSDASSPHDAQPHTDTSEGDTTTAPQGDGGGDSVGALPASYYDGLVITELMVDPVGISDANGEWLEIINTSDGDIDLSNCRLQNASGSSDLEWNDGAEVVAQGGVRLLGPQGDTELNGGLALNATYSDLFFANSGDTITLECSGHGIDQVVYDGQSGWPLEGGRSMALIFDEQGKPKDRASPDSWCAGSTLYTVGNYGSPGSTNPECPILDLEIDDCRFLSLSSEVAVTDTVVVAAAAVFEAGVTDLNPWLDVSDSVIGELGWVLMDEGLTAQGAWSWEPMTPTAGQEHPQGIAGWDVYTAEMVSPPTGFYAVVARFSRDGGLTWRQCSLDGSWDGADFGVLATLTTGPAPCTENSCSTPPANLCQDDGLTLEVYDTPGVCLAEGLEATCTFSSTLLDCSMLGGSCESGTCIGVAPAPTEGDVIFSEVMPNPDQLSDADAEWFELTNISDQPLNLDGCVISELSGADEHTIAPDVALLAPPNTPLLFVRSSEPDQNGGLTPDYEVSGVFLSNLADSLVLTCNGAVVDSVAWSSDLGFPIKAGQSLQLAPESYDAAANDDGAAWCASYVTYTEGNLGSPGELNPSCTPPGPCDDVTCDSPPSPICSGNLVVGYEAVGTCVDGTCIYNEMTPLNCEESGAWCLDGDCSSAPNPCAPNPCSQPPAASCDGEVYMGYQAVGTCTITGSLASCDYAATVQDCAVLDGTCSVEGCVDTARPPTYGEVIISEAMINPQATSDSDGEWFELTNISDAKISLLGCYVLADGEVLEPLMVPDPLALVLEPGSQLVVASKGDAELNGGIEGAVALDLDLNNSDGAIELRCGDALDDWSSVIDSWAYTATSHAILAGVALKLSQQAFDADLNDISDYWCPAVTAFGAGDLGTPGAPNPSCPAVDLCAEVQCVTPPAPYCEADVAFIYDPVGFCELGTCTYPGPFQSDCASNGGACLSGQCLAPPSPVEGCSLLGDSPIDVTTGVNLPVQLVVEHEAPPSGIETPSVAPWTEVLLGPAGPIPDGELTDWTAVEAHYSTGNAEGEPPGDLYNASVVISDEGSFQILGRVSTDKGLTWTLCDRPTPDTAHGSTDGISSADTLLITSSAQPHLPVVGLPFITEIQLGSTEQAWIEVHNDSWTALDLSMCGISVDDLFFGWLDGAQTVVEPQGWMQIDGEVAESLLIEAEMGAITLICAEQTIDTTAELSALPFGDVMNAFLKPEKKSAQANDAPKSWCISADSTPGAANPSCTP